MTARLSVRTGDLLRWPGGGTYQPFILVIDDVSLIELVRAVELPFAEAEYDQRVAEGESEAAGDLGPRGSLAGAYAGMPGSLTFLPSRNLLGEPFEDEPSHSVLLGCTCGVFECWMLLARIEVTGDRVRWSDFQHRYRPEWRYDLAFELDRAAYEAALRPPDGFVP